MSIPRGNPDQVLSHGSFAYALDPSNIGRPLKADSTGYLVISEPVYFEFRPGQQNLAGIAGTITTGAVLTGVRTGSGTITSGTVANSTYWGTDVVFNDKWTGKVDGLSSGGILEGQLTIGAIASAATTAAKFTARIKSGTSTTAGATIFLGLSGTAISLGATTEIYTTYDLNYLKTDTVMNSVPFAMAIGVESSLAGTFTVGRIMESTTIRGKYVPGT